MENLKNKIIYSLTKLGDVGFYACTLDNKKIIKLNEHKLFFTASCSKIITAIALYHKLEKESRKDSLILNFKEKDKAGGSGIMQYMKSSKFSIHNLLVFMLTISDNTASDLIVNFVTKKYRNKVIKLLGLKKTYLRQTNKEVVNGEFNLPPKALSTEWTKENIKRNNKSPKNAVSLKLTKGNVSTPLEYYKVLNELINPKIISKKNADKILNIMKHCHRSNLIADFGLDIEIAHKTGGIPSVRNDMGIVFSNKPFYFIMMGKNILNLNDFMSKGKKISNFVFKYFNSKL